jgi:hypothetical protein
MLKPHWPLCVVFLAALAAAAGDSKAFESDVSPKDRDLYSAWRNGPGHGPGYFPIAVWLQDPKNAAKYKAIGVNLFIGLWEGPTAKQLAELKQHGMPVICEQNEYARKHLDEKIIVGWMHGDEPDNAQSLGQGKGYGPPIPPARIVEDYQKIKTSDPTRPVILNLGQGVAWDGWYGRGTRTKHPEDYAEYVRGGDIVSFDIYPVVHDKPAVAGKLWYVARGVERLRAWAGDERIVWNCIECTRISNPKLKPTPQQVKAEVWMSIVHGSRGIVYFCHQFQPRFIEAALLADEEMARAVGAINRQIHDLAPVLNSPTVPDGMKVRAAATDAGSERARAVSSGPIAAMVKRHGGALYLFAVRMEPSPTQGRFEVPGLQGKIAVEVLGEDRTIEGADGRFTDDFGPDAVHVYKIRP